MRASLVELERNPGAALRADGIIALVDRHSSDDEPRAHARILRAQRQLQEAATAAGGERALEALGEGRSSWADDALYLLGSRREGQERFVEALALYDRVVKRFSSVTSNTRDSAVSRAEDIRRKYLRVHVGSYELRGQRPRVQVHFRNVRDATWTLKRIDPLAFPGSSPPEHDDFKELWRTGAVVSTWTSTLDAPGPYAPGTKEFELEAAKEPGFYLLEARADGAVALEHALVTQTATLTKTDRDGVLVWVADAETGVARPDADVALWFRDRGTSDWRRLAGKTDAKGLVTLKAAHVGDSMFVWTRSGGDVSRSHAGSWEASSHSREELAYVMTDRPLYKPGDSIGFKIFLRTREAGPSEPLPDREFDFTVTDPTGKKAAEARLRSSALGTATFTVPLPKSATLGPWTASVRATNGAYINQAPAVFRVEEFKPPESIVSVAAVGNPKPGEAVSFKVQAAYYSGGALANASGRALVTVMPWRHAWSPWPEPSGLGGGAPEADPDDAVDDGSGDWGSGKRGRSRYGDDEWGYRPTLGQHTLEFKTGADGAAVVEVPANAELRGQSLQYRVQVFVTDASRREVQGNGTVKVAPEPSFVDLRSDRLLYKPGENVALELRAEDARGDVRRRNPRHRRRGALRGAGRAQRRRHDEEALTDSLGDVRDAKAREPAAAPAEAGHGPKL